MRDLYEEILGYEGEDLYSEILSFWAEINDYDAYLDQLREVISNERLADFPVEDSWELYALSRVLDTLTLKFQPDRNADGSAWSGPDLTAAEYVGFTESLGLKIVAPARYEPFYYEIFDAAAGDADFQISEMLFPPVMLNNLLIKRGGAVITLDPRNFDLEAVNNSTIYWAYRRKNRKHTDLSHGWGSNSQWRTGFRFDFDLGDSYLYNAEGVTDLSSPSAELLEELNKYGLSLREAVELTVFRHLISCRKPDEDFFPYHYKYLERKAVES